jgi:DNA-binding transcriptional LysR family regulator
MTLPSTCAPSPIKRSEARNSASIRPKTLAGPLHSFAQPPRQQRRAEGVREGVFAGLGLAIASEWMFAPELKSGAVRVILEDWLLPPHDLWAVFPTGRQASTKARVFASFIEHQLAGEAASWRH